MNTEMGNGIDCLQNIAFKSTASLSHHKANLDDEDVLAPFLAAATAAMTPPDVASYTTTSYRSSGMITAAAKEPAANNNVNISIWRPMNIQSALHAPS